MRVRTIGALGFADPTGFDPSATGPGGGLNLVQPSAGNGFSDTVNNVVGNAINQALNSLPPSTPAVPHPVTPGVTPTPNPIPPFVPGVNVPGGPGILATMQGFSLTEWALIGVGGWFGMKWAKKKGFLGGRRRRGRR